MGIIIKPIVTEKQTAITEKMDNRYGFRVSPDANKLEIKKAIEDMYNVTVVDVNTITTQARRKAAIPNQVLSMANNQLLRRLS